MTVEAELADGRVLEFPDGTAPEIVQATVKRVLAGSQPTAVDRGKAAISGVNRGIAGLLGLPVDTAENVVNLGIAGVGSLATASGRPDLAPQPLKGSFASSEAIARLMERFNIGTKNPRPEDTASRMLHTGGMIAGGSMVPGAGVKSALTAAGGGAVAGEVLGPEWTGVGAMAPAAAGHAAAAAKNAVAAKIEPNVQTFKEAGTAPSVAQATESNFIRGLENLITKFPGGVGVMRNFAERQQAEMGAKNRTGVSAEDAGRAIERGVTGAGGFLDRTKAQWTQLDNAVAAKIPKGAAFVPSNTVQALDDLTRPVQGAEQTTRSLVNPKISDMAKNLTADLQANNWQAPFEALRALRSKVGSMLDESLVTGIPGGELKKVYGALSKDLEAAATQAGAGREFARQNGFYRARMDRIETVLDRVIGKGKQPEDIFKAFNPTDPDQANKARAVMRSLSKSERQVVSDAVVNRLGRATPGKQNEVGDVFSSETFLTNWNKLSAGAKAQLFDGPTRGGLDSIAKASANLREGSKTFANPSGTAGVAAPYGLGAMAATGNVLPAAGMIGAAYIGAKMFTNPQVVRWLATPVNPRGHQAAEHLARLGVIYNSTKDQGLKEEISTFVASSLKQ